jgi:hypothetical protein
MAWSSKFIIRIRGELVDMVVGIAPDTYKTYVSVNHRVENTLIVRCHNAIYGTMVASIQYYRKFTKSLLDKGFSLLYNRYVLLRVIV